MREKKREKKKDIACMAEEVVTKKPLFEVAAFAILTIIAFFLPFASYTYNGSGYTMSGLDFIIGKVVAGGKVTITTNIPMCLVIASILIILVTALLYGKISDKPGAGIITIMSIILVVCNIVIVTKLSTLFSGVKNVGISYGAILMVVAGLVIVVRGLNLLWKQKVVSTLDFMIVPGMLYFIINNYIPMFGITIAFKKIDYSLGIWNSPWVGLKNFQLLFAHSGSIFKSDAFIITRNTLLYNIVFIILGTIMGIIVGICLADIFSKTLQKFFQTSILLPQLISMVIVAYIVYALFSNESGMINKLLGDENAINFYAKERYWPFILTFVQVWKQVGYNAIIFLSSIVGIDHSIYEAARVDGASKWAQIKNITLPMLKPTIITLTLLQVGRIFYSDFGLFYQVPMNSGALYNVTNTIDTYVYRCLMVLNNISTASAASTYQAIVGFALVLTVNLIVRKADKENAMF